MSQEELKARNKILEEKVDKMEETILDLTRRLMDLEKICGKRTEVPIEKKDERKVTGLLFVDSNRNGISPAGLSFGDRKTIMYPCPTLEEVPEKIAERNVGDKKIDPDTILISTGTNTWDTKSDDEVLEEMKTSVTKIKETWPAAETKIQEFLPRLDKSKEEMERMNKKIKELAEEMGVTTVSPRISKDDLRDNKHVKDEMKSKLALVWKFAMNPKPETNERRSIRRKPQVNYRDVVNQFRFMARQLNIRRW